MELTFIFSILILIMSIVIHELSHGYTAQMFGDPTPRLQGRLTLNPIKHLTFIGSFLVPTISYFLGGFIFGWAKPIEYNPYNIKNPRVAEPIIALAGPVSNILIAVFFGLILRFGMEGMTLSQPFIELSSYIVLINIVLAIFNMVPLPPLDGSKVLFALLPQRMQNIRFFIERSGFIFVIIFIFFFWQFFAPLIPFLFRFITGIGL